MKHSKVWAPAALRRVPIKEKMKVGEYLIADSLAALAGLVQMDVLEVHTWNSCFSDVEHPNTSIAAFSPRAARRAGFGANRVERALGGAHAGPVHHRHRARAAHATPPRSMAGLLGRQATLSTWSGARVGTHVN